MRTYRPTPARLAGLALGLLAVLAPAAGARPLPGAPGCPLFPAASPWNQRVDALPVAAGSRSLVQALGIPHLHPDFGTVYGIPFNVVSATTPRRAVAFDYADESDAGPYPIPASPRIEDGSDRHLLALDRDSCRLYELYAARRTGSGWHAGSGAVWDLGSLALHPDGWTSADAAGLPILPGLARRDELAGGIDHALRFTVSASQRAYLWPARHFAADGTDPALPPMGLRVRLKASYPIGRHPPQARAVLLALQRYGMVVADNGTSGYVTGAPDPDWNDDDLHTLHEVPGSALEVVDTSSLPGTPGPRLWNPRTRVRRGTATVRAFLSAGARVQAVVLVRGRVVARGPARAARQGLVVRSVHARAGARYRLVIVR